jgi:hypothetical protein
MTGKHERIERVAKAIMDRNRRKRLMYILETVLEDLVELDGIPETSKVLAKFQDQLKWY